jgi:AcrR family transcriptional regulator
VNRPPAPRLTRRDRRRLETIGDIKTAALGQLARGGEARISMRAIARELDLTASAVHYYFPGRQVLVDALIVDGFGSLATAVRSAYEQSDGLSPDQRWLIVARAHRSWALRHPAQYMLIYGHAGGAARRVNPQTARAMWDVVTVFFALMRGCARGGQLDLPRLDTEIPASLRPQFTTWRETAQGIDDLSDGALAACMLCYSRLHGAIALELAGHLPPQLSDPDALFDMQIIHTAHALHHHNTARDTK